MKATEAPIRFLRRPLGVTLTVILGCTLALTGCISSKYKFAKKNIPAAHVLDAHFPPAPLDANLVSVISDGGPGSWKQEAFWDEYIVTLRNTGERPIEVTAATLADFAAAPHAAGTDPWSLERESKTLERRYRDAGIAFARMAAPRVLVTTAEPVVLANAGVGAAGAAAAATATAVALPVYGVATWGINRHHKAEIKSEFNRRRLSLPLMLAPGQTRTGSLSSQWFRIPRRSI